MRKRKSEIFQAILTVLVTLLLAINILFQSHNDLCEKKVAEIQTNITESWFRVTIHQDWASSFLETNQILYQLNKSIQYKDSEGKDLVVFQEFIKGSNDVLSYIDLLKEQMELKKQKCTKSSFFAKIALYLALILSLISISFLFIRLRKN